MSTISTLDEKKEAPRTIAISVSDLQKFGCPYCGYRSGSSSIGCGGSALWKCGECDKSCAVLTNGVVISTIGINCNERDEIQYPKLQSHPRQGIPAHGQSETS
jgi:hypothetical protein